MSKRHPCANPDCPRQIPPQRKFCERCWVQIPADLRERFGRLQSPGRSRQAVGRERRRLKKLATAYLTEATR